MSPHLQLRKLAKGRDCDASADWLGWHFGYFMPTERILHKLTNFAHAHDSFIRRITHGVDPIGDIEHRVRNCLDVHGRRYGPAWAAYDGKLPSEPAWPRNPVAPSSFNLTRLEMELRLHEGEVARASKRQPAVGPNRPLLAALGRLSATKEAISLQRHDRR
jgi:hypothetical protein